MNRYSFALGALALGAFSIAACDSGASDGAGHVRVRLTDAPSDEFAQANVTFTRVELVGADSSRRVLLSDTARVFDLLRLRNGVTAALAEERVPEGTYTGLRLVVADDARIVMLDGTSETLKIPSGTSSGIKVPLPRFTVDDDNDSLRVTIDFDVDRSFVKAGASGKYIFKPVLRPLHFVVNGDTLAAG